MKTQCLRRFAASVLLSAMGAVSHAQFTCSTPVIIDYNNFTYFDTRNTTGVSNDNGSSGAGTCITTVGVGGQVWYKFTWPGCDPYTVSLSTDNPGTNFDTKIHVYTGTCGALTCVNGDDDSGTGTTSFLTFTAMPGQTYLIRVGGFNAAMGTYNFSLYGGYGACTDVSACNYEFDADWDNCSCCYEECLTLTLDWGGVVLGQSIQLVNDAIWYSSAEFSEGSTHNLCVQPGCDYYLRLHDYSGQGWQGSTYYLWENGILISQGTMPCTEGNVLDIPVDIGGVCGCTNPASCTYDPAATLNDGSCILYTNSDCNLATPLAGYANVVVDVGCEPTSPSEGLCGGDVIRDLWYSFVYTGGNVVLYAENIDIFDTRIAVWSYCGGDLIACNDDNIDLNSMLVLNCSDGLDPGHTYYIQAGGFYNYSGSFRLHLRTDNYPGCTNISASNYEPCANIDDGSCQYYCPGDFTGDNVVNVSDLLLFMSYFGSSCSF
jgi:hypothetical protein